MQLAARVFDQTAHGTPLPGPGSHNVRIDGQQAWRATVDVHQCPLTTGTVPHVGGVVQRGSGTVTINGFAAARMGDTIVEAGLSNTIVGGSSAVIIR